MVMHTLRLTQRAAALLLIFELEEQTARLLTVFCWPFLVSKTQQAIQIVVLTAIILSKYAIEPLHPHTTDALHPWIR